MKIVVLLLFMAAPFVFGGIAANSTEGSANLCVALFFSILMIRESTKICLLLMRRWQMVEQEPATLKLHSQWGAYLQPAPIPMKRHSSARRDIYRGR